jgi:hypothetical protein
LRGSPHYQTVQQALRAFSDLGNGGVEYLLVHLRWLPESADLSNVLEGGGAHLVVIELLAPQGLDTSAHRALLSYLDRNFYDKGFKAATAEAS